MTEEMQMRVPSIALAPGGRLMGGFGYLGIVE
jgi:hypothetical protein